MRHQLAPDVAGVTPVAVFGPNQVVAAVDDQFAAVAGSLLSASGNGFGLRGEDNGGAFSASRFDGPPVVAGRDVDVFAHDF